MTILLILLLVLNTTIVADFMWGRVFPALREHAAVRRTLEANAKRRYQADHTPPPLVIGSLTGNAFHTVMTSSYFFPHNVSLPIKSTTTSTTKDDSLDE